MTALDLSLPTSGPLDPVETAAAIRRLLDRADLADLADRYLRALDDRAWDQQWAASVFTEDVQLDFPPGSHEGLTGVEEFTRGFMNHWDRTHHNVSHYSIQFDGDQAEISWNVVAIHTHRGSPPPPASAAHFYLGGRFEGTALRTRDGWRLRRLTLRVVWTSGPGIKQIAQVMTGTDGEQVINTWKAGKA